MFEVMPHPRYRLPVPWRSGVVLLLRYELRELWRFGEVLLHDRELQVLDSWERLKKKHYTNINSLYVHFVQNPFTYDLWHHSAEGRQGPLRWKWKELNEKWTYFLRLREKKEWVGICVWGWLWKLFTPLALTNARPYLSFREKRDNCRRVKNLPRYIGNGALFPRCTRERISTAFNVLALSSSLNTQGVMLIFPCMEGFLKWKTQWKKE